MNKVILKTFYNRYTRGTPGPVPFEKSFSISTTTTTQFEQLSNLSVSNTLDPKYFIFLPLFFIYFDI